MDNWGFIPSEMSLQNLFLSLNKSIFLQALGILIHILLKVVGCQSLSLKYLVRHVQGVYGTRFVSFQ